MQPSVGNNKAADGGNFHRENTTSTLSLPEDTNTNESALFNTWTIATANVPLHTPERSRPVPDGGRFTMISDRREPRWRRRGSQQHGINASLPSPTESNSSSKSQTSLSHSPLPTPFSQRKPSTSLNTSPKEHPISTNQSADDDRPLEYWLRNISAVDDQSSSKANLSSFSLEPSFSQSIQERFGSSESPGADRGTRTDSDPLSLLDQSQTQESSTPVQEFTATERQRQDLAGFEGFTSALSLSHGASKDPQLAEALDFERRKKDAMQKRREHMRDLERSILKNNRVSASSSSPHLNRYLAARAALSSNSDCPSQEQNSPSQSATAMPSLSADDPRAYLKRQQGGLPKDGVKIERLKTSKLPFETIAEKHRLHNVSVTQPTYPLLFSTAFQVVLKSDLYTRQGVEYQGLAAPGLEDCPEPWWHRLLALLGEKHANLNKDQETNLKRSMTTAITEHSNYLSETIDAS